jgi:hypothetical protein
MTERDSFNKERSGKLPIVQISKGMPVKASTDCLRKLLLIYARIFIQFRETPYNAAPLKSFLDGLPDDRVPAEKGAPKPCRHFIARQIVVHMITQPTESGHVTEQELSGRRIVIVNHHIAVNHEDRRRQCIEHGPESICGINTVYRH